MINRGWPAKALADPPQNIKVRQSRFHQDNVGAFGKIEFHFTQRFVCIGRIHLIGAPITELRRAFRRIPEWSVKNGGKLGRIAHNPGLIETCLVERCPDRADSAIHHVAWCDHIGPGGRVRHRRLRDQLHAFIVKDVKVLAAKVSEQGDNTETSVFLWNEIYSSTTDPQMKENAAIHLQLLKSDTDCKQLDDLSSEYEKRTSKRPTSLRDLVTAGLLKGMPMDPAGYAYVFDNDGKAQLNPESPLAKKKRFYQKTLSNLANR